MHRSMPVVVSNSLCIDVLEGGIEGGREDNEGTREGGKNQLLLVHNMITF